MRCHNVLQCLLTRIFPSDGLQERSAALPAERQQSSDHRQSSQGRQEEKVGRWNDIKLTDLVHDGGARDHGRRRSSKEGATVVGHHRSIGKGHRGSQRFCGSDGNQELVSSIGEVKLFDQEIAEFPVCRQGARRERKCQRIRTLPDTIVRK